MTFWIEQLVYTRCGFHARQEGQNQECWRNIKPQPTGLSLGKFSWTPWAEPCHNILLRAPPCSKSKSRRPRGAEEASGNGRWLAPGSGASWTGRGEPFLFLPEIAWWRTCLFYQTSTFASISKFQRSIEYGANINEVDNGGKYSLTCYCRPRNWWWQDTLRFNWPGNWC